MGYNEHCKGCPYADQQHLDQEARTIRRDPPVEAEVNESEVLVVALAPGVDEWRHGRPLMPCIRRGGTAGSRVLQSWKRARKDRSDFDISEAVQCYPGRGDSGRDKRPAKGAVANCLGRLRATLVRGNYRKVIALGELAFESLQQANAGLGLAVEKGPHPTSGASRDELDALW